MNFEHALEAMKQGKKVQMKSCQIALYFIDDGFIKIFDRLNGKSITVPFISYAAILADDWEIHEEPQKEPEMTAEHAIEVLETVRKSYRYIPDIDGVIHFAIEAIEKQNQQELVFDPENLSKKELEKLQEKLKECKLEVNPEKKCECERNCSHTGTDTNLQEVMEQALSRKFFELADTTTDSLAVSNMIEIYRLLFEVK